MVTAAKKAAASKPVKVDVAGHPSTVNHRLAANNAAVARLRDAHLDEFHDLLGEECEKRGIVYERPLSAKEKAHKQILDLIAKHGGDVIPGQDEVALALTKPAVLADSHAGENEVDAADEPDASSLVD
jgi:hypothetical protein